MSFGSADPLLLQPTMQSSKCLGKWHLLVQDVLGGRMLLVPCVL